MGIDLSSPDPHHHVMKSDRPFLGILCMLVFCFLAPLGDAIAKSIGDDVPLLLVLFVRFGMQAAVLLPFILVLSLPVRMGRTVFGWMTFHSLLHIFGVGTMYLSLRYLPLADALAIAFVMPFIMLLLGKFFLNEEVGRRRISACIVGFGGTLLVIQPSFADVGWPALLPVAVALIFAIVMLITRIIAKQVDPVSLQASSGIMASAMLLLLLFIMPPDLHPDFALTIPADYLIWLMVAVGLLGTAAHLMMTISLRFAPSATVAPMQYLEIPFATMLGWLVFNELPNGLARIGILITIAAGLYIIAMEHRKART